MHSLRAFLLILPLVLGCNQMLPSRGSDRGAADDDDSGASVDDDDATDEAPVPVAVACLSPATSFTYPFGAPETVQLSAEVTWSDGAVTPTSDVAWVLQGGFGGNVNPTGLFTFPWDHGGQVTVEAWYDSLVGTCTLDLHVTVEVDGTADPAIAEAVALATPTIDPSCAPSLLYPVDDTVMPRNWVPLQVQWSAPPGANVFVVQLTNEWMTATYLTVGTSLQPELDLWRGLLDTWSGDTLQVQVFAGIWDGAAFTAPLCGTNVASLPLSATGLEGQIFYWAAAAEGIYRLTLGASTPTVWADTGNTGWCVGCHTTNLENPRRMAKVYGGGNGWVTVSDVEQGIANVMPAEQRPGNFTALDPTGQWLIRSFEGALYLDDLDAGVQLGTLPTAGYATHPNWSPDGLSLVYSSCDGSTNSDWVQSNCSLRSLDRVDTTQFGNDQLLVAGGGGVSNYYASYSPDSAWIAFNRALNEDSYDATSAALWLMASDGSGAIELAATNQGPNLSNSWPRWGVMHDDYVWLAFASRRAYGQVTSGTPQVWLAGLDTNLLGTGVDPSAPGLWLAGQDPTVGNHTPVWVPRFVEP